MKIMQIFLSYAREDSQIVYLTGECLKRNGYKVIIDKEVFEPGVNFHDQIEQEIKRSDGFIFFLTPNSLKSPYCEKELQIAQKHWKDLSKHVLPARDVNQSIANEENEITKILSKIHYLEAENDLPIKVCEAVQNLWPIIKVHNYTEQTKYDPAGATDDKLSCPYLALSNFGPNDADLFYGRSNFVDELLKKISQNQNLTVITGASGSGKSSVVLAGLIPELAKQEKHQWIFSYFRPGHDPFFEFASALSPLHEKYSNNPKILAKQLQENTVEIDEILDDITKYSPDKKILFVVDQLGHLLTHSEEICIEFLKLLYKAIEHSNEDDKKIFWVITIEGTNLENSIFLSIKEIHNQFKQNAITLYSMDRGEITAAIELPAKKYGITIEPALITKLIEEMHNKSKPENLAVLEFTLWKLWGKQVNHEITFTAYKSIGGVKGAIKSHAENIFINLDKDEQDQFRNIFKALAFRAERTEIAVRTATKDELIKYWPLVIKLAGPEYRLIVLRNDTVEVIHDAVIRNWEKIEEWATDEWLRKSEMLKLEEEIIEWKKNHQDSHYLLTGKNLRKAQAFAKQQEEDGNKLATEINEFLFQSEEYEKLSELKQLEEEIAKWEKNDRNAYWLVGKKLVDTQSFIKQLKQNGQCLNPKIDEFMLACEEHEKAGELKIRNIIIFIITLGATIAAMWGFSMDIAHKADIAKFAKEKEKERIESLLNRFSQGEKQFKYSNSYKRKGTEHFKINKFECEESKECAIEEFKSARKGDSSDPETLIYLNNARIANDNPLTIAAVVPFGGNEEVADEMLRGIAQAQDKLNKSYLEDCKKDQMMKCNSGIKGRPLRVIVSNDDNNKDIAKEIAKYLIDEPEWKVVAVIGHNASEVSSEVAPIYQEKKLVMATPTSFALKSGKINSSVSYIYAVTHSHEILVSSLIEEVIKNNSVKPTIIVCSDEKSPDQKNFKEAFINDKRLGVKDVKCDFSSNENHIENLEKTISDGANNLFLSTHVNRIGDVISLIRIIRKIESGESIKLYGSPTLYTDRMLRDGGADIEGLTLAVSWFPKTNPDHGFYKDSVEEYWKVPNAITWRTAMSYDATNVLIEGLKQVENLDDHINTRTKLAEVMSNNQLDYSGATGKVEFFISCDGELTEKEKDVKEKECNYAKRKKNPIQLITVSEAKETKKFYEFIYAPK